MVADSVDHIPPRYLRAQMMGLELAAMREQEVPACRDCHSVLGRRPLLTITDRRAYVKASLRRRYARMLRIPNWTQDQLAELGDDLRRMIERNLLVRDEIRQRLRWHDGGQYAEPRAAVCMVSSPVSSEPPMATVLRRDLSLEAMGYRSPQTPPSRVCANCHETYSTARILLNKFCCTFFEYYKMKMQALGKTEWSYELDNWQQLKRLYNAEWAKRGYPKSP